MKAWWGFDVSPEGVALCVLRPREDRSLLSAEIWTTNTAAFESKTYTKRDVNMPGLRQTWTTEVTFHVLRRVQENWRRHLRDFLDEIQRQVPDPPDSISIESPLDRALLRVISRNSDLSEAYHIVEEWARTAYPRSARVPVNAQQAKIVLCQRSRGARSATKETMHHWFQQWFDLDLSDVLDQRPDRHPVTDMVDATAVALCAWYSTAPLGVQYVRRDYSRRPLPVPASTRLIPAAAPLAPLPRAPDLQTHLQQLEADVFERDTAGLLALLGHVDALLADGRYDRVWLQQHREFITALYYVRLNNTDSLSREITPVGAEQIRNLLLHRLQSWAERNLWPVLPTLLGTTPFLRTRHPNTRALRDPLRWFLDLSFRLNNIPHRTQAMQEMQWGPHARPTFVCKLVQFGTIFQRVWYQDKVGGSSVHMPVNFPLDPVLSALTWTWLAWFRGHGTDSPWAFPGERFGTWTSNTAYHQWLQNELQVPVALLERQQGRRGQPLFLHRLRNIMLACYGAAVAFDPVKMERLGLALRHSYITMKRTYLNQWGTYVESVKAIRRFSEDHELDLPPECELTLRITPAGPPQLPDGLLGQLQALMKLYNGLG